jgi:CHAT domain-containing protein
MDSVLDRPEREGGPIQEHLSACDVCRTLVRRHAEEAARMNKLKVEGAVVRGSDCPPESTWLEVAAGTMPSGETAKYLEHVAVCDYCGKLMRRTAEDFADELTPGEETILASLQSTRPAWQERMARQMATESRPHGILERLSKAVAAFFKWPNWTLAATAAAVILSIGVGIQLLRPASATQLLAKAYTEQRSLELRFPGAGYAPMRVQKGGGDRSRLDRPPALLDAEAKIARELAAHPEATDWLQAKGRADLLDWNYEAAIKSFKRALEAEPDSPALQADLAAAYFERAEAADRAIDYGTTIELLAKALKARPDDPVMLFNYAVVLEKMFVYQQAIETWRHYLRVDSKSDWAAEARKRLAELEQKKKVHDQRSAPPPADPAAFLRRADAESEDYLDTAIVEWLPAFFSARADETAGAALKKLAGLLREQHGDRWLADVLKTPPSLDFTRGVEALSKAVKADLAGNPSEAESESKSAQSFFRAAGSQPGALRARLEEVYALHRSGEGKRCLAAASSLSEELRGRDYAWANGQLLIEQTNCWGMAGDHGSALDAANRAIAATSTAGFGTLHLRSLGISAAVQLGLGNSLAAWSQNRAGLAVYWAGSFPAVRGYQFYRDLCGLAETLRQIQTAVTMMREGVLVIAATPNRSAQAIARNRLATLAVAADRATEAEAEFDKANRLFGALPTNQVMRRYRMDSELTRAAMEVQRGEVQVPLARLERLRGEVSQLADFIYPLRFHRALATVHLRQGDDQEAENDLQLAIGIAERGLASVATDRDRLTWARETGEVYRSLVRLRLERRSDPEGALRIWEWYRAATLRSEAHAASDERIKGSLPNLPEIKDALPDLKRETVISYAQFEDKLALWAFDDRGITAKWLPVPAKALDRLAQRFLDQCADPSASITTLERDGRQLYQWLLAPIAERLADGRTLVIEPDGVIAGIPFQALVDSESNYLGSRFAMTSSPGVWVTRSLVDKMRFSDDLTALVIGMPTISPGFASAFPPLAEAAHEASVVAAQFRSSKLVTGDAATLGAVEERLPGANIFHFAGHGFGSADGGGLLLAGPGGGGDAGISVLSADRIRPELFQRCKLAVLSACSTGIGEREGPANPDSLVRALIGAHVPHVLASRWNIDSSSTAALMGKFYQTLLLGESVSASLRAAAAEVQRDPKTSRPFYWAGLNAFGRP